MSTKHAEQKVTSKSAEADRLVAVEPKVTALSCEQLCGELANDLDILDNLSDFPANQRAAIRAAILRSMTAIRLQMRSEHCPPCE
jgi:hypothetical protein